MKQRVRILAVCGLMAISTSYAGSVAQQPGQSTTDPALNAENPVAPATPSEQAVDMQSFDYESKHDAVTSHSNTPPADTPADKPLPDSVIRQDVLDRFSKVYQEKKKLYDQAQFDLTAAKNDLVECEKLSAVEKNKCVTVANGHIEALKQKISNLNYDMNNLKNEMQSINPSQ